MAEKKLPICSFCKKPILEGEKRAVFKRFYSVDYEEFHNRFKGDCWDKEIKEEKKKK